MLDVEKRLVRCSYGNLAERYLGESRKCWQNGDYYLVIRSRRLDNLVVVGGGAGNTDLQLV